MNTLSESSVSSYDDPDVASRKSAKGWGGKRPGAGRKLRDPSGATKPVTVRLAPAELDALEAFRSEGEALATAARRAMLETLGG